MPDAFFNVTGWFGLHWILIAIVVLVSVLPERFVPPVFRHWGFQAAAFFVLSVLLLAIISIPLDDWFFLIVGLSAATEMLPKFIHGRAPRFGNFVAKLAGAAAGLLAISAFMLALAPTL